MKQFLLVVCLALPFVCAAEDVPAAKKTTKTTTPAKKAAPAAAKVVTIPADAVKTGDNTYSKTDAQGKTWLYVKTPFGVTKSEAPTAAQKEAAAMVAPEEGFKVVEEGDNIRFSKNSPFGVQTWTRNKNELTDDERGIWERQKQAAAKRAQ
jgi:hypothetical protein